MAYSIVTLMRFPHIVLNGGRLWAEEGVVYFQNALKNPWYQDWFATNTIQYIHFSAGFFSWVSLLVGGVQYAPLLTVFFSLLLQLITPIILVTHRFPWQNKTIPSFIVILLCAMPPLTGEVWLNTLQSQMHLAVAASLILSADAAKGFLSVFDLCVLILAGLSGPSTIFLLPLFLIRTYFDRSIVRKLQTSIVFLCFSVQLLTYLTHHSSGRHFSLTPFKITLIMALHTIILPIGGVNLADHLGRLIANPNNEHILVAIFVFFLLAVFYSFIIGISFKWKDSTLRYMALSSLLIGFASFFGAWKSSYLDLLSSGFSTRYAFTSELLNTLILFYIIVVYYNMKKKKVILSVMILIIMVDFSNFRADSNMFDSGPKWKQEISIWSKNPNYSVKIWPKGWAIKIPKKYALDGPDSGNLR